MEVISEETNTKEHFKEEVFKERLNHREIWLNGDIDNMLVEKLYVNLLEMNDKSKDKILVMINSWGGDLHEGHVATDIMKTVSAPIITVALAKATSAGFTIFMGGDQRLVHNNTCLMMHAASTWAFGKVPSTQNRLDYITKTMEKMAVFFAKQTNGKTTIDFWMKILKGEKDVFFTAEEALKLGIAHKIIGSDETIDSRYLWRV